MIHSWLLMDIRVKGKFKINAVEQSLSVFAALRELYLVHPTFGVMMYSC